MRNLTNKQYIFYCSHAAAIGLIAIKKINRQQIVDRRLQLDHVNH